MPRYYFHVKDGHTSLDNEGTELADIHAARREAVTLSGAVLRDGAGELLWDGQPWQLWVTDASGGKGNTFFTLNFSATDGRAPSPT
jgi:hypothetical protein